MISSDKFYIKHADECDVESIVNIVKQSFVQYCNAIGIDTVEALCESDQDVLNDMRYKHVYIAYWNGIPVSTIRIESRDKKAVVSRFAILPEYQGLGIGSEMLLFIEKTLTFLKVETVELYSAVDNKRLKSFYEKNGYRIVSVDHSNGYQRGLFQKNII